MAREIETYRSVTNVTPDISKEITMGSIAERGQQIIAAGQEAKITENFSKAQLELNTMSHEIQRQYENDPMAGREAFKTAQDDVLNRYGEEISPFFRGVWQKNARDLGTRSEVQMEGWAYTQTKKNTVRSINNSIKLNMSQATLDGQNFGNSEEEGIGSMLNYSESKKQLAGFGDKNIGAGATTDLLESYDEDYLKSFMSGVAETNPIKALRMMDDDKVKSSFRDQRQYTKMKNAIEDRAMNITAINGQKQVLNVLKDENSLLAKSINESISYADLQKEFDASNLSPAARSFFLKANGYSKAGEGKITESDKLKNKAEIFSLVTEMSARDDVSSDDISKFQDAIYRAMDNKSISQSEGLSFINQLVNPFIEQKEKQFGTFSQDHWFMADVGFGGVQEYFEANVVQKQRFEKPRNENQREEFAMTEALNNENKVKLYDYYYSALGEQAETLGITVADIASPRLNDVQRKKIFSDAQKRAVQMYSVDRNPALSTLNDLPNQTFSEGKLTQGAAGDRDIKPNFTAQKSFDLFKGSDGVLYRKYKDGRYEQAGKWK